MNKLLSLLCLAVGLASQPALADQAFPSKRVRVIIPFPPGQGSDILARAIGDKLAQKWGQPVVVENRAGANGSIALQEVARAEGDGYTLLVTSNSPVVINPNLYKHLPYDVGRDFQPVALLAATDMLMVVNAQFPATTLREVIAQLKANPGKFSYGSPGTGSTSHLSMEVFKQLAGVDLVHVPYKGSPPAFTDLIGGSIKLMIDALPSAMPQVKSGRVRAIAITSSDTPSTLMPDVPLASSAGLTGLPGRAWYGMFAPKATPPATMTRIVADVRAVLQTPEIVAKLPQLGLEAVAPMTPQEFGSFVDKETAYWADATRRTGMYQIE
ncbi:tripartite tricarboxylate transporter substrate binding protein [Pigmentiphaga sp. H8]|uniref:Bug family tripartite tricarboxylate transporter substrate binding protein n=1 Tax=Pigmentiphaga sp. H8 TaxID=2488560 RepID=UPI000F58FE2C|nr:tripartite tricarboxylate transporter substrate binding protein [Pigmentiphaga sp. H8]AZG10004.1 tripartite tricarboxylate transporter substrate binding protein [Pigmentiphaga sp. H8]